MQAHGQGDIVIYENNKVVMIEATLMNANSQKRGEWEPVLRHSINLKINEETAKTEREVTSFFIGIRLTIIQSIYGRLLSQFHYNRRLTRTSLQIM